MFWLRNKKIIFLVRTLNYKACKSKIFKFGFVLLQEIGKLFILRKIPVLILEHDRPPDKRAYWKIIFFISHSKTYVVGTQKNRLNETALLSTQNVCLN